MRITFVLPHAGMAGGIRVLAIYADLLQRRRHSVTVVSLPQLNLNLFQKVKSFLRGRGWPKKQKTFSYFDNINVPHNIIETVRPISDQDVPDADVIVATFWKTAPWVASMSPAKGAKAILLQGYERSPGREDPEIDAVWRLPINKIVISEWMVDLARMKFGDDNVYLVPNSVDMEQFSAPERQKNQKPTVGLLYSTLHLKGLDISLEALRHARLTISNLSVVAFGAEKISPALPLPDWVEYHYLPPQNALRHLYEKCDVWLCGSRREGFHLPPLEAMACRCPVVSTRVGGPLDTILQGVNGYLVDVEDSIGLADRLIDVLKLSNQDWKQMSDAALATASKYTWNDATDLFEKYLYQISQKDF